MSIEVKIDELIAALNENTKTNQLLLAAQGGAGSAAPAADKKPAAKPAADKKPAAKPAADKKTGPKNSTDKVRAKFLEIRDHEDFGKEAVVEFINGLGYDNLQGILDDTDNLDKNYDAAVAHLAGEGGSADDEGDGI